MVGANTSINKLRVHKPAGQQNNKPATQQTNNLANQHTVNPAKKPRIKNGEKPMRDDKLCFDDGYYFGLGAFETIAVYNGNPIFAKQHVERMANTLNFLNIEHTQEELFELINKGLHLPEAATGAKALKIAVSNQNRAVSIRQNIYTPQKRQQGFKLKTASTLRNQTSKLVQHKTLNYAENILEKRLAISQGFDEPLFCNYDNYICEGATTNIFVVTSNKIITPPTKDGLLPGIMRDFVLENFSVDICSISFRELSNFDEIFITNSLMGIMPVVQINNAVFQKHTMAQKIQTEYEDVYGMYC